MNSFVNDIARLFSSSPQEIVTDSNEDLDGLTAYYSIKQFDRQPPHSLNLEGLSERDILAIGLFDGVDETASEQKIFRTDRLEDWGNFIQHFNNLDKDDPIKMKISITKKVQKGTLSVYCPVLFTKYLKSYNLKDFLSLFNDICKNHNTICFEYQEGSISLIGSSLAFVSKGHVPVFRPKPILNIDVVTQGKSLCCNDLIFENLLPTDFELSGTDHNDNELLPLFKNAALLYSLCFLFDFISIRDNELEFKLNGYKTITGHISVDSVENSKVDTDSWAKYLEIFKWQYNSGNLTDKSAIARNIISLNIVNETTLSLREGAFDAISSNYRIYEKENVKQYIEIRNNVSNQLRDYQKYIITIYDDFESAFKKLFFSFLTFAFTTAIIRVLAKNIEDNVLVPDTIIILLLGFCFVSFIYYFYARWERNKKVKLFDKQYNDTRKFYEELLSEKEMSELFTDERNNDGTYRAFIEERTCYYDYLWMGANLIFFIVLLYIKYFINGVS